MVTKDQVNILPSFPQFGKINDFISQDRKYLFTTVSYVISIVFYLNLTLLKSLAIGSLAFIAYFLINAVFLGRGFFSEESVSKRTVLGILLLIMLLGLVGWTVMIIYNLDTLRFFLVMLIVTTASSFLNRRWRKNHSPE